MENYFTMYLDESGVANLADNNNQYFILTGIIIENKTDAELSAYFGFIKRRHKLKENISLHAYDIFENKEYENYLNDNKLSKKFTSSIAEFIENSPFKILVFYIDKNEILKKIKAPDGYQFKGNKKHKEDKEIAYEILARKLFFDFAKILKKEKAIGSIVAESRRNGDLSLLRTYLDTQDTQAFNKYPKIVKNSELAKNHIHSICFSGKKSLKSGLELADMISYCAFNELNKKFPPKRKDKKGIKEMWGRIKKQINISVPIKITSVEISKLAPDRIDEISNRIKQRLNEYRDLVNPTQR